MAVRALRIEDNPRSKNWQIRKQPSNGSNDFILFLLIHFWLFGGNEVTSRSAARSSYHPTSGLAS
jgi:hypothetical protein